MSTKSADGSSTTAAEATNFGDAVAAVAPAAKGVKVPDYFYVGEHPRHAQTQTDVAGPSLVQGQALRSTGVQAATHKRTSRGCQTAQQKQMAGTSGLALCCAGERRVCGQGVFGGSQRQ